MISENGKEILSMNEVMSFLLQSNKPLLDTTKLPTLLKLSRMDWTSFVDGFRGMIVTCPGRVRICSPHLLTKKQCCSHISIIIRHFFQPQNTDTCLIFL